MTITKGKNKNSFDIKGITLGKLIAIEKALGMYAKDTGSVLANEMLPIISEKTKQSH